MGSQSRQSASMQLTPAEVALTAHLHISAPNAPTPARPYSNASGEAVAAGGYNMGRQSMQSSSTAGPGGDKLALWADRLLHLPLLMRLQLEVTCARQC